tara:strand:- start:196 stop:396 length:201 start_codon:yes stop_codon:yes gene_type:complete
MFKLTAHLGNFGALISLVMVACMAISTGWFLLVDTSEGTYALDTETFSEWSSEMVLGALIVLIVAL